jgi:hypothetical protein
MWVLLGTGMVVAAVAVGAQQWSRKVEGPKGKPVLVHFVQKRVILYREGRASRVLLM